MKTLKRKAEKDIVTYFQKPVSIKFRNQTVYTSKAEALKNSPNEGPLTFGIDRPFQYVFVNVPSIQYLFSNFPPASGFGVYDICWAEESC